MTKIKGYVYFLCSQLKKRRKKEYTMKSFLTVTAALLFAFVGAASLEAHYCWEATSTSGENLEFFFMYNDNLDTLLGSVTYGDHVGPLGSDEGALLQFQIPPSTYGVHCNSGWFFVEINEEDEWGTWEGSFIYGGPCSGTFDFDDPNFDDGEFSGSSCSCY